MNGTVISEITEGSISNMKKPTWVKGLTSGEQMYVMEITNQEEVKVDAIDDDDLYDYKKCAKRVSKQFKK